MRAIVAESRTAPHSVFKINAAMTAAAARTCDRCRRGPAARGAPGALAVSAMRAPRGVCRSSSSCTASACRPGNSAARGSTGCSPATCPPRRTRTFASARALRVSAHVLIRRDGELMQYVPFTERAWHAGASAYRGSSGCNDFSIGIELEGTDEHALHRRAVRGSSPQLIAALHRRLSVARGRAPRGPLRRRPGAQDRSGRRRSTGRGCAPRWPRASREPERYFGALVAPQHLGAALVAREHARDHEQQVREAVQVLRRPRG